MADDLSIKLLIEAEDNSRQALEQAKANTQRLIQQQKDLFTVIRQSDDAEVAGNKEKTLSADRYFATRAKAQGLSDKINSSHRREELAVEDLNKTHNKLTEAVEKGNERKAKSTAKASNALMHYVKHFVSLTAAEETIRRSIEAYAEWERGMARIELQTGKTGGQVTHLGHTIDGLARMTGISVEELQKNFMTFQAGVGEMGGDVEKAFKTVVEASHAAGVSVDVMGRTAIAALKTMQVPYSELKGMLDVVVDEIPASAMQAWDAVGPKILGVMRSLGSSGKDSVTQAATAFGTLTHALGNATTAGNVQLEMMKKGTDQSTFFGKTMTRQLIELNEQQATSTEKGEAFYQQMAKMGVFDADPQRALFFQQQYGFSDEMVRGAKAYHEQFEKIRDEAAKTGETFATVEQRITRLNRGPKKAIDELIGALGELLVALGKFLGPTIPDTLSNYVKGLTKSIEYLVFLMEKWRELIGARTPEQEATSTTPAKPAKEKPWLTIDPGGSAWMERLLTGKTEEQQAAERAGPGMAFTKPGYGVVDWLLNKILPEMPHKDSGPTGPTRGRAQPGMERRPGFAEGGAFTVGGQGGRDTEPVSFMATRGERVAITTAKDDSLQVQQDKADIAAREHFARFHGNAFTKMEAASWWGDKARAAGISEGGAVPTGTGGGAASMPMGPRAGGPGGPRGPRGPGGAPTAGDTTPAIPFSGGLSEVSEAGFVHPVLGGKILSHHGDSRDGGRRVHRGIDINAPIGTTIQATTGGQKITQAGWLGTNYGWGVKTIDEHGREHVYAHMHTNPAESHGLKPGQVMGQGAAIGHVGKSGNARTTPPHLHYEVRPKVGAYNQSHNPTAFLPGFTGPGGIAVASPNTPGTPPVARTDQPGVTSAPVDPRVSGGTATPAQIYQEFRRLAQEAGSPNPDLTAALAMHESGAGITKNSIYERSGRTNPFGQTGNGPAGTVIGRDGQPHMVYKSLKDAFEDHLRGTHGARGKRGWESAYVPGNPQKTMENLRAMGYNTVNRKWLESVMAQHEKYKRLAPPLVAANKPATAPVNTALPPPRVAAAPTTPTPTPATPAPAPRQWGGLMRAGRDYIVGESGPETFRPNRPGELKPGLEPDPDLAQDWQDKQRYGPLYKPGDRFDTRTGAPIGQNVNDILSQHRAMVAELSQPIRPQIELPRAGPMRQRMSRRIEVQRERDVGRMTRYAAHSDIGMA